jgi:APA family basic amino acid/polyamine antiporter
LSTKQLSVGPQLVQPAPSGLRRELNLFDAIAVVVGTIIGSGIFLIPSTIAAQLHSLGAVLLVWIVGGILTVFGVLSLAEVGSIYPGTGGLCTYLRHTYGPLPAFLYAWALLVMIHSGSIAALAVAFGLFAGQLLGLSAIAMKLVSGLVILVLTTVSCLGIRSGKLVQNIIFVAKVSGLGGMIAILIVGGSRPVHLFQMDGNSGQKFSMAGFGIALIAVLWAYEGWHVISFVAGEMKRPRIDLPRSLLSGIAIVILIFLVANIGYYHTLSAGEISGSERVAALATGRVMGPIAANALSVLILVSILGSMNGLILTGPRVYYAMARDGIFPGFFGRLSDRFRTPVIAQVVQGIWASVLAVSGSYQQIFTDVIFTAWVFYGLAVGAVLVLRRTQPHLDRGFRVPGYPWIPLLFCAAVVGLIVSTFIGSPWNASVGMALVVIGIPVYWFSAKRDRAATK